jgi:crossover junction endodeoxyribonuclease RuvC
MSRYRSKAWRAFQPDSSGAAPVSPAKAAIPKVPVTPAFATCRILGLDPGSRRTGYGVIELSGAEQRCLAHGRVEVDGLSMPARLARIHAAICELMQIYQPTEVAVEKVFVNRNVDSALKLGQARGAALAAVGEQVEVAEYAPRAIKLATVGFGGADKMQVAHMMRAVLKVEGQLSADAADALAVALCHAHHRRMGALLTQSLG